MIYCHGPDETEPACHADVLLRYANREAMGMTGYISNHVSLAQVRHSRPKKIWYGAQTCWWTHDARDLCREPASGLPCDPRGGMLFVTDDPQVFLDAAEANPEQYGRHGLRAFMAAHNRNCQVSILDMRATCFRSWDEYNALLDAQPEAPSTEEVTTEARLWSEVDALREARRRIQVTPKGRSDDD